MTTIRMLVLAALTLMSGCVGGVRVIRSSATLDVPPAPIALVDLDEHTQSSTPYVAEVAAAFAGAFDETMPSYPLVRDARARYRLAVTHVEVARNDGDTHAAIRVALSDDDGTLLDELEIHALGHDPEHAGREAARHLGRYLDQRTASID